VSTATAVESATTVKAAAAEPAEQKGVTAVGIEAYRRR
jgi:hypothetical protein